jgi:guanylate kinase
MEKAIMQDIVCQVPEKQINDKIIVIIGKAASGKSSASDSLAEELNIKKIVTYTTRPVRDGEVDGVDYNFITYEQFKSGNFACKEEYTVIPNGPQGYGVNLDDFEPGKNYIIVLTPSGFHEMKQLFGERIFGIYIMAPVLDRWNRYLDRDYINSTIMVEAGRRFKADEKDFYELEYQVDGIIINKGSKKQLIENLEYMIFMECLL